MIELLVTIIIIAVLLGLIAPTVYTVLEKGKSAKCIGNLRIIGNAMLQFIDDYNYGPPSSNGAVWDTVAEKTRKARWNWPTHLAPYLGAPDYEGPMSSAFDCPSDPNVKRWPKPRYYLPGDAGDKSHTYTSYGYNNNSFQTSQSTFYSSDGTPKPRPKFLKQAYKLILVAEGRPNLGENQEPIIYYIDAKQPDSPRGPSLRHLGLFNAFLLDGHIESFPDKVTRDSKYFSVKDKRTDYKEN